jgi:exopolyphosphatase / guanosine-5'-triphosphate,3'-diphosphate pyrophosphatase
VPRRGAIDVGTNSVRLLVADVGERRGRRTVHPVVQRQEITRLGEGFTPGGSISDAAAARTADAVSRFLGLAASARAGVPTIVGTYALRSAANPAALLGRIPHSVRILSGDEEARLGYVGVLAGLRDDGAGRLLVIDIGGGSVELTRGNRERIADTRSVPAGAVLLTERFLAHDPPLAEEIAALRAHLAQILKIDGAQTERADRAVGVGGTITTLAAMAQGLTVYDPEKVHGFQLARSVVDEIVAGLAARTVAERRRLPGLQPARADIILAGALVLRHLLAAGEFSAVTVSEADLLWGLVLDS